MAVQTKCPECKNRYTLADNLAGKKIRCQACKTVFEVQPSEQGVSAAKPPPRPKNAVAAGGPPARRREVDDVEELDEDERDDEEQDRPRKKKKRRREHAKSSAGLIVGIIFGILAFIGAFVVVFLLVRNRQPEVAKAAPNPPAANQAAANPAGNQAAPNPPAGQQPMNPPVNQNPPVAKAPGVNPVPPADLYGDQGGEEVAPADPHLVGAILRARKEDTFYRLSNPRIGRPDFGPGQALLVDYEVTRRGKFGGGNLVIHSENGRRENVHLLIFGQQDRGTIQLKTFGGPFGGFPKNAEFYMARSDGRYGKMSPTFKVSNSVIMGVMPVLTKARNWTQEEIALLLKEPPPFPAAGANPGVGQDTPFAGDVKGGIAAFRYVDPNGHLLGLEFNLGAWDKEQCIGAIKPVFHRDQPETFSSRIIAKEGYAVAGAEVHAKRFVNAIKLQFQRIRPDGNFDPADAYASEWIGYPGAEQPQKLAGDGKRVIGIHQRQGGVIHAVAFVTK